MQSFLNILTLAFVNGLICLALAIVMIFILKTQKTYAGFRVWTTAFAFNFVANILLSLREYAPPIISIVFANSALILFFILVHFGIRQFFAQKSQHWKKLYVTIFLMHIVWVFYFTYIEPNIKLRMIEVHLLFFLFSLHSVHQLLEFTSSMFQQKPWILMTGLGIFSGWSLCILASLGGVSSEISSFMSLGTIYSITFIVAMVSNTLIVQGFLVLTEQRVALELEDSEETVKELAGLLPICSNCKDIRNDEGYWERVEQYISTRADVTFTHSLCPKCVHKIYPELLSKKELERIKNTGRVDRFREEGE